MQTTSRVFMIRPSSFGFNEQTAVSNSFQNKAADRPKANQLAQLEFDNAVVQLKLAGIDVIVFDDTISPVKPDAVFPNNWISLHADGTVVLYPMCTPNRRTERRLDILEKLIRVFEVKSIVDLSHEEENNRFLEGTGSIVFDHINKIAYACISPRTDKVLFEKLCIVLGYEAISFYAHDSNGKEIYHTNVMMCIAEKFAVVCLDSISDKKERALVISKITRSNREVIDISFFQMEKFAGNMLGLKSKTGEDLIVLSQTALNCLDKKQRDSIENYNRLIPLQIPTIETIGGGSARCMIAEIFCVIK